MMSTDRILSYGALLSMSAFVLTACDAGSPSSSGGSATIAPPPASDAPSAETMVGILETIMSDVFPTAELSGSARFGGASNTTLDGDFGSISDLSDRYETYIAGTSVLEPGYYGISMIVRQSSDRAEDAMLRVQSTSEGEDEVVRYDLMISANGTITRQSEEFSNVDVEALSDGFQMVKAEFQVPTGAERFYRIMIYPAAGMTGRFDAAAEGSIDVGGITLVKLERR